MKVFKYQALGNDYLVIDALPKQYQTKAFYQKICDRNFGIGSDGVLLNVSDKKFGLKIINPDGSEAEKSGNGLRIFAKYCVEELGAPDSFEIQLPHEKVKANIKNADATLIEIEMGQPKFNPDAIGLIAVGKEFIQKPIQIEDKTFLATCVSMGNPHCVIQVKELSSDFAKTYGPKIENHPWFKNRTNVQFAKLIDNQNIQIEIWERGAGYTLASGTSSCAVASAFKKRGLVDDEVNLKMPGGTINIRFESNLSNVFMTGAVEKVFEAEMSKQFLKEFE